MKISDIEVTNEGIHDPHIFKAVFMSGAPGSGKTTISRQLFAGTGLKHLNFDNFWYLYNRTGKTFDNDQMVRNYLTQRTIFLRERLGVVLDSTGKNRDGVAKTKELFESYGYDTLMVFVNVDLETAQARAEARTKDPNSRDFGRVVPQDFVAKTWGATQNSIGYYQSLFGANFYVVDNSDRARKSHLNYTEKKVAQWLRQPVNNPIAKQWFQDKTTVAK